MSFTPPSTARPLPFPFYVTPPKPRPVDPKWQCQREGDCCSKPAEVVMTHEERLAILPHVPQGLVTHWRPIDDKFVALKAGPCPFYIFKECLVYPVRPYNCRRFACMRPDPKAEPWEEGGDGPNKVRNVDDRIALSRPARRLAAKIQHKAQKWALKHGWSSQ